MYNRFEYDPCAGIRDLSINEDDDQFLYPQQIVDIMNDFYNINNNLNDNLRECRARKRIMIEKLERYYKICEKYHIYSTNQLDDFIKDQLAENIRLKKEIEDLTFALRTEQALQRVEDDDKPYETKEEFLKRLDSYIEKLNLNIR